jgi:hypothetical protein
MIEKLGTQVKTMRWHYVSGFEDGERYEIGIEDGMQINEWLAGSLEDILARKKSGVELVVQREAIKFELKGTVTFEMKRSGRDGHMEYGWRRPDAYEVTPSQAPRERITDGSRTAILEDFKRHHW